MIVVGLLTIFFVAAVYSLFLSFSAFKEYRVERRLGNVDTFLIVYGVCFFWLFVIFSFAVLVVVRYWRVCE